MPFHVHPYKEFMQKYMVQPNVSVAVVRLWFRLDPDKHQWGTEGEPTNFNVHYDSNLRF